MKYTDQPSWTLIFNAATFTILANHGDSTKKTYSQVTRETSNHRRLKQGFQVSITLTQGRWDYKYTNVTTDSCSRGKCLFQCYLIRNRTFDREFANKNN